MKYVKVKGTDLKSGDIIWDSNPQERTDAIKLEVVNVDFKSNKLYVKYIGGSDWYNLKLNDTAFFQLTTYTWYREEASND